VKSPRVCTRTRLEGEVHPLYFSSLLSLQVLEGPWALSTIINNSFCFATTNYLQSVLTAYLEKGIQTPMAQGRSTQIISMIKWIRTSRLSIKNSYLISSNPSLGPKGPTWFRVTPLPGTDCSLGGTSGGSGSAWTRRMPACISIAVACQYREISTVKSPRVCTRTRLEGEVQPLYFSSLLSLQVLEGPWSWSTIINYCFIKLRCVQGGCLHGYVRVRLSKISTFCHLYIYRSPLVFIVCQLIVTCPETL
jgi:hypothetical protein